MKDKLSFVAIGAIAIVLLVWFFFPDYILARYHKVQDAGAYGDIFGAVNALFTSLAFALLIYTALMQREELKLQREELRETRKELAKSAQMQEKLVQLTSESTRFQKELRKNQIRPELKIKTNLNATYGTSNYKADIILTPKLVGLIVKEVKVEMPHSITIYQRLLEDHYLGRVIEVNSDFVIEFEFFQYDDLQGLRIDLLLLDTDRTDNYRQTLIFEGDLFRITASSS